MANPDIGDKVIFKPRNYANGKEKTNDPNWNEHGVVEKKFVNAFDEGLYWIRLDDGKLHFANQKEIEVI